VVTTTSYSGQLAAKLQEYRSLGMKEGGKNRPPQDAGGPDQHEVAVKSQADGYLNDEQRLFDAALTEASREATTARQKVIQHQLAVEQLVSDTGTLEAVDAELASDRMTLVRATEARLRAEAEIKYFKAANNIHEEASYPDSKIWHFGLIFGLAVVEMVANAFFFENNQGLLGGLFVAAGIAFLNMGSALMLGAGFRYKNLASIDKKVFGWACLAVFVLVAIFCNALFASFRSEYQLVVDPTEAGQVSEAFVRAWPQALAIFRADMQLKDQASFILFGFGLILSTVAFLKGYGIDDRHPGYGAKDRRFKERVNEEHRLQETARQKVRELLHARKAAVQAAVNEPNNQIGLLARRVADLQHARNQLHSQATAIEREYVMVVEAYRHSNTSVRAVAPPEFFKERPALSARVDSSHADAVAGELAKTQDEIRQISNQHKEALNQRLVALQNDTSEVLKKTMNSFLADVQKEASDAVSSSIQVIHRVKPA
jgi:hypothetical protein